VPSSGGRTWLAHDAFRGAALGDRGWYVLATATAPMTCATLALRTGLGLDTLDDMLPALQAEGLLEVEGQDVFRPDDLLPRLDRVALQFGVAGSAEVDRARHREDRARFRGQDVNVPEVA
jgi:hypothetical protein